MKTQQAQTHRFSSSRLSGVRPSIIKDFVVRANQLKQVGRRIYHFEVGRPDFDTPEPIKQAAMAALARGQVHYTMPRGIIELRQAIVADVGPRLGLDLDPERNIIVSPGSTNAINLVLSTVLEPGDEMLVPEPMYLFYLDWGEPLGAATVGLPLDEANGFQIDPVALEERITPKTKVIVINSPHNPTGSGLNRASLEAVARAAIKHDLLVVADEVYDRIIYPPFEHVSIASLEGMAERTVIVNSLSKPFAMDGWRIGYLIGPAGLVDDIEKIHHRDTMCAATFIQYGALEAFRLGDELIEPMVMAYSERRNMLLDMVADSSEATVFKPEGAFYLWVKLGDGNVDDGAVAMDLLEQANVCLTPGSAFGPMGRGRLRVSFAASREDLELGVRAMLDILPELMEKKSK